ncbi:MAG: glycosyltransferase, partial [Bacteroidota bacterium]
MNPSNKKPIVYLVLPCYNEEQVLPITAPKILHYLQHDMADIIDMEQSKIVFVNDGSKDNTWNIIKALCVQNEMFRGIKLATNFGHQFAVLSGLLEFKDKADCYISLDADLQDDISAIKEMMLKFIDGYEIVYGVRKSRNSDTFFKRNSALAFYKLM